METKNGAPRPATVPRQRPATSPDPLVRDRPMPPAAPDSPCRQDPDAWFLNQRGQKAAAAICRGAAPRTSRCPLIGECLEYALANDERFGVWGGMTERQRAALRRKGGRA